MSVKTFAIEITGTLQRWRKHTTSFGDIYWGDVYGDNKKRFPDGKRIHTSLVNGEVDVKGGRLIFTMNSVYFLPENEEFQE